VDSSRELLRHLDVIASLTAVMRAKDPAALDHIRNVSTLAELFLASLPLGERERWAIHIACLMRDIGKLAIGDEILQKKDVLTREEYQEVRRHPVISAQIVQPLKGFDAIVPLVRYHHERWDGKGYPDALRGDQVPYGARVVGIIDAFYAMIRRRPYADQNGGLTYACEEIRRHAGAQFDPDLARRFLAVIEANRDIVSTLVEQGPENEVQVPIPGGPYLEVVPGAAS
jgi:HD-GYP domain-containing protein (c-di-GMP phosphodiesterase class II)